MAAASGGAQLKRSSSYEFLPPYLSELRVVLLGSSWSQRSSVGRLILGEDCFKDEAQCCLKISRKVKNMTINVINTPDLQFPTANKMTEFIKDFARLSAPGPHVFLLVVQPEDFTMKEKNRICIILETFNDQSFDHLFLLILKPRQKISGPLLPIKEILAKCSNRYLKMEDIKQSELLSRFKQIVQQNSGEHISYEGFDDAEEDVPQGLKEKTETGSDDAAAEYVSKTHNLLFSPTETPAFGQIELSDTDEENATVLGSFNEERQQAHNRPERFGSVGGRSPEVSDFRIVLLGRNEKKMTKLGNLIVDQQFNHESKVGAKQCLAACGEWSEKTVTVVKTPNMFSLSNEEIQRQVKKCVRLCSPGPNVLLLLVKPSEFTENDREKMMFILSLFGQDAFKHSLIILTNDGETGSSVNELLRLVQVRCYSMNDNDRSLLMKEIENIVEEKKGKSLTFTEETVRFQHKPMKPLNLVLFGRRGSGKTSAAKVILGQIDLQSASNSLECVRNQGEVHGCWVSVVELPALCGKPQQEVMEESFRCISLCEPEGVHAFILVLPVGPLTDEDKGELQTIQDTFSSRVNDFTIILFTTESDPTDGDVNFIETDRNIQELLQSCGGRYVVLNITDRQKIPELMESVDKYSDKGFSFSLDMFTRVLMERTLKLKQEKQKSDDLMSGDCVKKESEELKKREEENKKYSEEIKALEAELEHERMKVQQLKEKDESMKKVEKRKKECEEEKIKYKRKEESEHKECQEKLVTLEKQVSFEQEQKRAAEKKMEQSRQERVREREALEKEKDKIWERMHEELKQNLQEMKMNPEDETIKALMETYRAKALACGQIANLSELQAEGKQLKMKTTDTGEEEAKKSGPTSKGGQEVPDRQELLESVKQVNPVCLPTAMSASGQKENISQPQDELNEQKTEISDTDKDGENATESGSTSQAEAEAQNRSELPEAVEGSSSKAMSASGQMENISQPQDELNEQKTEISDTDKDGENATESGSTSQAEAEVQNRSELSRTVAGSSSKGPMESCSLDCLRIVLIGKTGSGKSSSGNTILGQKKFKAGTSPQSVTMKCQKAETEVDGRFLVVVDTPGLFDNNLSPEQVNEELMKCIDLLAPGPHVFLLVIPIGRLSPGDRETFTLIEKVLGENYKKFTMILFTKGDTLKQEDMSIEDYIKDSCDDSCKKLISDCGGRYHVFENYDKKNRSQVTELIQKIDELIKVNGGSCYTSDLLNDK